MTVLRLRSHCKASLKQVRDVRRRYLFDLVPASIAPHTGDKSGHRNKLHLMAESYGRKSALQIRRETNREKKGGMSLLGVTHENV